VLGRQGWRPHSPSMTEYTGQSPEGSWSTTRAVDASWRLLVRAVRAIASNVRIGRVVVPRETASAWVRPALRDGRRHLARAAPRGGDNRETCWWAAGTLRLSSA